MGKILKLFKNHRPLIQITSFKYAFPKICQLATFSENIGNPPWFTGSKA